MIRADKLRFKAVPQLFVPSSHRSRGCLLRVEVLERRYMLSSTDLAGPTPLPDTQPPQIASIQFTSDPGLDVFASNPTLAARPPINSLTINFQDGPVRSGTSVLVGHNIVFVLDTSNSMNTSFNGAPPGITKLKAEVVFVTAFIDKLNALGLSSLVNVSIVTFNRDGTQIDMDPNTAGVQFSTTPSQSSVIEQILKSLPHRLGTNFEAGLNSAIQTIHSENIAPGDGDVILLSDGYPYHSGPVDTAVAALNSLGMKLFAFGVGPKSSLKELEKIDPFASRLSSSSDLLALFTQGGVAEPALNHALASDHNNYQLVGDDSGPIAIKSIDVVDEAFQGSLGFTTVRLNFVDPLPNDHFELTISDALTDVAGNALDGEINLPSFPSGNGTAGGSFIAGFTVNNLPIQTPVSTKAATAFALTEIVSTSNETHIRTASAVVQPTQTAINFNRTSTASVAHDAGGGQLASPANVVALLPVTNDSDYGGAEQVIEGSVPDIVMVQFQAVSTEVQVAELSDANPDAIHLPEMKPISEEPLTIPQPPVATATPVEAKWYVIGASSVALLGSLVVLLGPSYWRRRKARILDSILQTKSFDATQTDPRGMDK